MNARSRLRWWLLVPAVALGVHAGRYAVVGGHHGAEAHGYLSFGAPALLALALLAPLELALRLVRLKRATGAIDSGAPPAGVLWLGIFALLVSLFVLQEGAEAVLSGSHGHAEFALGGTDAWTVLPFAATGAAVIAFAVRTAAAIVDWVVGGGVRRSCRPASDRPRRTRLSSARTGVLARRLAGRAPPVVATGA